MGVTDIPGVPWVGTKAKGQVGGNTLDQVWKIELLESRQAVIEVVGEPRAELGLYIFDSTATSVISSIPIAQSAKPGLRQRISIGLPAGTYFVNVNGRNTDRLYSFQLLVSLVVDATPPYVFAEFDGGRRKASSTTLELAVAASDSLSGVKSLRVKIDSADWTAWGAYEPRVPIRLYEEEGLHAVLVEVMNGVGLTARYRAEIVLDLKPPVGTLISKTDGGIVYTPSPVIKMKFNEDIRASSWTAGGITLEDSEGGQVFGRFLYDSKARIGTYLPRDLVPGTDYFLRADEATDEAGNPVVFDAQQFTYMQPTSITPSQNAYKVFGPSDLALSFKVNSIPAGANVAVEKKSVMEDGSFYWETVGMLTLNGQRTVYAAPLVAPETATYSLHYLGSVGILGSRSGPITVIVAPKLSRVGGSALVVKAREGMSKLLKFQSDRDLPGAYFEGAQCSSTFQSCRIVVRVPAGEPTEAGVFETTWKARKGYWRWRLIAPATPQYPVTAGPTLRFLVGP